VTAALLGVVTAAVISVAGVSSPVATASAQPPYAPPLALSVYVAGAGTVSGGGINCATTCTELIPKPSLIALTPKPARGSYFVGWGGACWGEGACTVVMNAPQSVQAAFIALPNTKIRSHRVSGSTLTLAFGGTGGAGHLMFTCKLDARRYTPCSSPARFSGLTIGAHTVAVRAWDSNGKKDSSPARLRFRVG
jgi:hypothetical protein